MAESKELDMFLKIVAKIDVKELEGLVKTINGLGKRVNELGKHFKELAATSAALFLGFKGFEEASEFIKDSIGDAKAAKDAQDKLGLAVARNARLAKLGPAVVAEQSEKLKQLAEDMNKTGMSTAVLSNLFAGLATRMSPKMIYEHSKGLQGTVIALKGLNATSADAAEVANTLRAAWVTGRIRGLAPMLNMTKEEVKAFGKLHTEQERQVAVLALVDKQEKRYAASLTTDQGKIYNAQRSWERLRETLGKPFVDTQVAFTQALGDIADALQPLAEELAEIMTPALQSFARWLRDAAPAIKTFGQQAKARFDWVVSQGPAIAKAFEDIGGAIAFMATSAVPWLDSMGNKLAGWGASLEKIGEPAVKTLDGLWPKLKAPLDNIVNNLNSYFEGKITFVQAKVQIDRGLDDIGKAISTYDWSKVSEAFSLGISKAISSVNLGAVFATVFGKDLAKGGAQMGAGGMGGFGDWIGDQLAETIGDFTKVGQKIGDKLKEIDWGALGKEAVRQIAETFSDIGNAIARMMGATDWNQLATVLVSGFQSALGRVLAECATWGPKIVAAINAGIGNIVVNVIGNVTGITPAVNAIKQANIFAPPKDIAKPPPSEHGATEGYQYGGLVAHRMLATLGERGPEMVIPLMNKISGRSLLGTAASMLGMGGMRGGGTTAVHLNAPITINGVDAGQGGAIAREVQRAMQDPINTILQQLRRAKDEERRLSYV
jgi:hypothetical protein